MSLTNLPKYNQEKLLLPLGFILVLSAGFFSGYFYLQSQIEKREVVIEEPDQSCKDLFNLLLNEGEQMLVCLQECVDGHNLESVNSDSSSNPSSSYSLQAEERSGTESANLQNKTGMFVASKNSNIYHKPDCRYAKLIKEENKIWFQSAEEAEKAGYKPDKNCLGN